MMAFLQADIGFERLTRRLPIIYYLTRCPRSCAAWICPITCYIVNWSRIDFLPNTLTTIPGILEYLFALETTLYLMGRHIILLHRILGDITNSEARFVEILLMLPIL